MTKIDIAAFADEETRNITYVLVDKASGQAAVVDSILRLNPQTGAIDTTGADAVIEYLDNHNLALEWILETCIHSDHLTASAYLKQQRGGQIGIGEGFKQVQSKLSEVLEISGEGIRNEDDFDCIFADGEVFHLGHLPVEVLLTPGHTPCCVCYRIDNAIFVGDALLMPTDGTPRTDLPNSCARHMYQSIQRLLALPDNTRIFLGHGANPSCPEAYQYETSVVEQRRVNQQLNSDQSEKTFVAEKVLLDAKLPKPRLKLHAIRWNMHAGQRQLQK